MSRRAENMTGLRGRLMPVVLTGLTLLAACDTADEDPPATLGVHSRAAPPPDPDGRLVKVDSLLAGIGLLEELAYWDDEELAEIEVPRLFLMRIDPAWQTQAETVPVGTKKELFYRLMLPLALQANALIAADRVTLDRVADKRRAGTALSPEETAWLRELAAVYRLVPEQDPLTATAPLSEAQLDELLLRVDAVPPSLALGQAAYESAYGTSRFARLGNALFGQWTWSGKGLKPERQRGALGDHRIAAFDTPLDSMLGYARNLNSHAAYAEFRERRAALRRDGAALDGLVLSATLTRYSERGGAYVETLQQIIRVNQLQDADSARLAAGPPIYLYPDGQAQTAARPEG